MKPLDYTLYNKVKEKFPPQPNKVIFVSLAPENLEKLEGVAFTVENLAGLGDLIDDHSKNVIPFATIGGFDENDSGYSFYSHEFDQHEDLSSGKVVAFSIDTYHDNPPDIESLKNEMKNVGSGTLLCGNA